MKKVLGLLGLAVTACAACCAIPIALPALGALFVTSTGIAFGMEEALCVALLITIVSTAIWMLRKKKPACNATNKECHCDDSPNRTCGMNK